MTGLILLLLTVGSVAIVAFGWIGYPLVLSLFKDAEQTDTLPRHCLPAVSVIIATREQPAVVRSRLDNILKCVYPEAVQIIVALDGALAGREDEYRENLPAGAKLVLAEGELGKASALNAGVRAADNEILVFTDSRQEFATNAIRELVTALCSGPFSAVSGRLAMPASRRGISDLYWKYELWIRRREARVHSMIGVTGAIYAMRRAMWRELPCGVLCDDVLVAMWLVLSGRRVGFCAAAVAYERREFSPEEEFRRKVRTQTGILQLCVLEPRLLNPRVNPVWPQFVCHKLIRIATPLLLLLALPGAVLMLIRLSTVLAPAEFLAASSMIAGLLLLSSLVLGKRFLTQAKALVLLIVAPLPAVYFAARGNWDVWSVPPVKGDSRR